MGKRKTARPTPSSSVASKKTRTSAVSTRGTISTASRGKSTASGSKSRRPTSTASDSNSSTPQATRRRISLDTKLKIIESYEGGVGPSKIGKDLNMSASTICTIIKNADSIKAVAESITPKSAPFINRTRNPLMGEMEKLLLLWIESHNRSSTPLSAAMIKFKAQTLWDDLVRQLPDTSSQDHGSFKASNGWFERFKTRSNLHNIKFTGEAASADAPAAAAFPAELKKIIDDGGYSPKQVINIDETGLYWKRLPSRTFIDRDEKTAPGTKASKDRLTLLLGSNAEGDLKLKPLLVYHSENPRALKGYIKDHLPVIWRSNRKAWVTTAICQNYIIGYLSKVCKDYCAANNLSNKFLLVLDNAPAHPPTMDEWADNINVVFLPPNTTSLIQPMDAGVIFTFKAYYLRRLLHQLISETDGEDRPSLREFWRSYNIKKAIDNIASAWDEIQESTLNACWKKLWPDCVNSFTGFGAGSTNVTPDNEQRLRGLHTEITDLAHEAGFDEVDTDNVVELLQSHNQELSNDELMELHGYIAADGEPEPATTAMSPPPTPEKSLGVKLLSHALTMIDTALDLVQENDPQVKRSGEVARAVRHALDPYITMYKHKKKMAKQPSITYFMPRRSPASHEDHSSPPSHEVHGSPGPSVDHGSPGLNEDHSSPGPSVYHSSPHRSPDAAPLSRSMSSATTIVFEVFSDTSDSFPDVNLQPSCTDVENTSHNSSEKCLPRRLVSKVYSDSGEDSEEVDDPLPSLEKEH